MGLKGVAKEGQNEGKTKAKCRVTQKVDMERSRGPKVFEEATIT
jgi:uncharacterized membrane protein